MTIQASFRAQLEGFELEAKLEIPARGVTALFGPSGAGKSTILRAIAGLDRHEGGHLVVEGVVWQDGAFFLPPHKRPVGYVFQEPSLFGHLNVRRNVDYGCKRLSRDQQRVGAQRAIELLGIENLLERQVRTLSGGERQRVAMARALAVSPGLLLMDEPLAALDMERKAEILPYLEALVNELDIPVVYVSHSPDEVSRLADELVLLNDGRVVASGPISRMLTREDLPLSHGRQAEALVEATVTSFDADYALNYLDFPGGEFTVPGQQLPIGSRVRLRVAARDVSLTLDVHKDTSILNIFDARVKKVSDDGDAQVVVHLDVGGVTMLARVTRKSAKLLDLVPGKPVHAQVKSMAVLS